MKTESKTAHQIGLEKAISECGFTPIGSIGGDWYRLENDHGRILACLLTDRVNLFISASLTAEEDAYKMTLHTPEQIFQVITAIQ